MNLKITKRNQEQDSFVPEKYIRSLKSCGADDQLAQEMCRQLQLESGDYISTKKIFNRTRQRLRRRYPLLYTNYGLSQALLRLGPDGFVFERFIAALFEKQGMKTQVGTTQPGRCITHEVDMIAQNNEKSIFAECKFHNRRAYKNDIKVALYVRARYMDLQESGKHKIDEFWLISNTKFTQDAITYGTCAGLKILGSNSPVDMNLLQLIQKHHHYPITVLNRLSPRHLYQLQEEGNILLQHLLDHPERALSLKLSENHYQRLLQELNHLRQIIQGSNQ
jgi:hypothetical protein